MPLFATRRLRALARSLAAAACLPLVAAAGATAHAQEGIRFVDVAADSGLDFVHQIGARGRKHLPETMGSGLAWLDYDNDGHADLYYVQSGDLPGEGRFGSPEQPGNALYRNRGDGTLALVVSGAEDPGYGMSVTAADYDGDGWIDVFVGNFGADALYRNNGDGTFTLQRATGAEDPRWAASAAWGDIDGDSLPDLFVTNYLGYTMDTAIFCGEQDRDVYSYCHVDLFDGVEDDLYRNLGDGTFEQRARSAGVANALEGKGLGVVMADLDRDGLTDIYVANDTQQNFYYVNRGDWTFEDQGLFSGTGYSEDGKTQAGMGIVVSDVDGDTVDEILVTNFSFETNNLYRQIAPGAYLDETYGLGLGEPGLATLSFGIVAFDADADGDREVAIANGHILDNVDEVQDNTAYAQPNHLFVNHLTELRREAMAGGALAPGAQEGGWRPGRGLFSEQGADAGPGFAAVEVSRGLVAGDLDGDGLPDLAILNSAGPARLLRNETAASGRRIVVRLRGRVANRDALGARVRVIPIGGDGAIDGASGFAQESEVVSASSYCSQGSMDQYFGLADSTAARVEITWPGGEQQVLDTVPAGHLVLVIEGQPPVLEALR
jgi:hypothetical protein